MVVRYVWDVPKSSDVSHDINKIVILNCGNKFECVRFIISIALTLTEFHYNDVIMGAMASQITSLTIIYSTVYSGADQRKHQSSASLAFVQGIHRDRWIPRTNGQLRGKCFHLMTSSCLRRVSAWWWGAIDAGARIDSGIKKIINPISFPYWCMTEVFHRYLDLFYPKHTAIVIRWFTNPYHLTSQLYTFVLKYLWTW